MKATERVKIVNEIIKEIAGRGREFFKYENNVASMSLNNGRVYMKSEWHKYDMLIKQDGKPKNWHHGGTLMGLTKDFALFIKGNDDANGENGYGGLFCPHWGYSEEDMEAIRSKAKELGYLKY